MECHCGQKLNRLFNMEFTIGIANQRLRIPSLIIISTIKDAEVDQGDQE
jgi:hypothetical protein